MAKHKRPFVEPERDPEKVIRKPCPVCKRNTPHKGDKCSWH